MKAEIDLYRSLKTLGILSALVAGIAAAPALYGHESQNPQGSMMGPGMMERGTMMDRGNMMGMMNMMGQMNHMMENCNKMMQAMIDERAPDRPNDQLRKDEPAQPES